MGPAFFMPAMEEKMGGNGQSAGHGSRAKVTPRAQKPKAAADIVSLRALAQKSGTKADRELAQAVEQAYTQTKPDADQNDTQTQAFFNAIGWADNKPTVVATEQALEVEKFLGNVNGQYFYHTDAPEGAVADAKVFADQQLDGRHFLSNGIHGDGTYWSNDVDDSWRYGHYMTNSYQIKGMLNTNAKVIKEGALDKKIDAFRRSHPGAYNAIIAMYAKKGSSRKSVFAALFGYNVIEARQGGHDYLAVLDRSATTVVRQGIHRKDYDSGAKEWKNM